MENTEVLEQLKELKKMIKKENRILLTKKEVADMLGISVVTLVNSDIYPLFKRVNFGKREKFIKDDVAEVIKNVGISFE